MFRGVLPLFEIIYNLEMLFVRNVFVQVKNVGGLRQ